LEPEVIPSHPEATAFGLALDGLKINATML